MSAPPLPTALLADLDPDADDPRVRVVADEAAALAAAANLPADGRVLLNGAGFAPIDRLCALRDRLWPAWHVARVYRWRSGAPVERTDVGGTRALAPADAPDGFAIAAVRREFALSPDVTTEKFDKNAAGWNGDPTSPAYGHFRWMRRLVAEVAHVRRGETALDAGSGAGWVGIEAARLGARVCAFDPSPEMVKHVLANAQGAGVSVDARVGFVEQPPFDGPFDLVLNSGVISFAPDPDRFLAGLDRMVKRGGRLVIGDLSPESAGMRRRRRERATLPVREMNALPRARVEALLEARGYAIERRRWYQLTSPVPEIVHRRPTAFVCGSLLAANRAATGLDALLGSRCAPLFDSWLISARRRPA